MTAHVMLQVTNSFSAAPADKQAGPVSSKSAGPFDFLLRSNPLGDFLDGLLSHQPVSNKYDILWDVLHSSRDKPNAAAKDSKYDPVYAFMHSAAMEVRLRGPWTLRRLF